MTEPTYMMRLDLTGAGRDQDNQPSLSVFDRVNREIDSSAAASTVTKVEEEAGDSSMSYSLSSSTDGSITSLVFKSDYANLKHAQAESQRALQELGDTHAQRISRYIS